LQELGFTHVTVPKSHEAFVHADPGTEIFLPIYRPSQRVAPHHLVVVRHMLDVKGLLGEAAFDRIVAGVMVEHPASG
jgi:hypothetical protein